MSTANTSGHPTSRQPFKPTTENDWDYKKEIIVELFYSEKDGKPLPYHDLADQMRNDHDFDASVRMYIPRLHKWGCKRYMYAADREQWYSQLKHDFENGLDVSYLNPDVLSRLIRHYKSVPSPTSSQRLPTLYRIRDWLRSRNRTRPTASTINAFSGQEFVEDSAYDLTLDIFVDAEILAGPSHIPDEGSWTVRQETSVLHSAAELQNFDAHGQDMITGSQFSDLRLSDTVHPPGLYENDYNVLDQQTSPPETQLPPTIPLSLVKALESIRVEIEPEVSIPRPLATQGHPLALSDLLRSTHDFYTFKLSADQLNDSISDLQPAKKFWSATKSAIYLLKKQDTRGFKLLQHQTSAIPNLCHRPVLPLLRELFTTLSFVNADVKIANWNHRLRKMLLYVLASQSYKADGDPNQMLFVICCILQQDWVTDHTLVHLLWVITEVLEAHLGQFHNELTKLQLSRLCDEIVELHRARIQFLRRLQDFPKAVAVAQESRRKIELLHGRDSVQARLIMSEQVYISNNLKQPDTSLTLALDIVERAKRFDGDAFPSERAVYHLEDLAEIYEVLEEEENARIVLRQALRGAQSTFTREEDIMHIRDKLFVLEQRH